MKNEQITAIAAAEKLTGAKFNNLLSAADAVDMFVIDNAKAGNVAAMRKGKKLLNEFNRLMNAR